MPYLTYDVEPRQSFARRTGAISTDTSTDTDMNVMLGPVH